MVSNISFKSLYTITSNKQYYSKFHEVANIAQDCISSKKESDKVTCEFRQVNGETEGKINVPDYMDKIVENYCKYSGISYKKSPNISFGSTYKVKSIENGSSKFSAFEDFAIDKECKNGITIERNSKIDSRYPYIVPTFEITMVAPDSEDDEIEQFCTYNNIKYLKLPTSRLLDKKDVEYRITPAQYPDRLVKVNYDKLSKLIKNQETNIYHCENDYERYYKYRTDFMIKSGDRFPTSKLYINPNGATIDETIEYIKRFGAENLNESQLFIDLNQETFDPDHCMIFALRDLGMKNIPVYMNEFSYEIASALDIIEK